MVHFGDDLFYLAAAGVEGGDDVVSVVSGQRHKPVRSRYTVLLQHVAEGGVAAYDMRLRHQITEFVTALPGTFDDRDIDAAFLQQACQIDCRPAAAHDHHPSNRALILADCNKKTSQLFGGSRDAQPVAAFQDRAAIWNQRSSVPFHQCNQNVGAEACAEITQHDPVQRALFRDSVFDDLDAALGKGIDPGCARETQNTGNLLGTLILRINDLRQTHGIPQESHLIQIQRITNPGNHMLCPQFTGCDAAYHVYFVLFRRGYHKVRRTDSGPPECLRISRVSLHTDDIEVI